MRHVFIQRINVQTVVVAQQYREQLQHVFAGCRFIQRDADSIVDVAAQVDLAASARARTAALSATSTHRVSK